MECTACSRLGAAAYPFFIPMEKLFQQLIEQKIRTNDLMEKQGQLIDVQQTLLKRQMEYLELVSQRLARMEELQLQMGEILDRDLLSLLEQPLLLKADVMEKLRVVDSTYRSYVKDQKLKPMTLGKVEYYFQRDLIKTLLETKYRRNT